MNIKGMNISKTAQITISIAIVILAIVLVVSGSKFIRRIFSWGQPVQFDYDETPLIPGGEVARDFNPTPFAVRLAEVLYRVMLNGKPRCMAYKRVMELTDNEFILAINEYKAVTGSSLRADMDRTWQSGCTIFGPQWDRRVYDRMDRLNVIG